MIYDRRNGMYIIRASTKRK